ncbi:hypothetical protein QP028_01320 [Corynebacterium suedekumii]|nr:hypothetical protein QP028_01320 [Corynebacterium suedekumii]
MVIGADEEDAIVASAMVGFRRPPGLGLLRGSGSEAAGQGPG